MQLDMINMLHSPSWVKILKRTAIVYILEISGETKIFSLFYICLFL